MLRHLALVAVLAGPAIAETRAHTSRARERVPADAPALKLGRLTPGTTLDRVQVATRGSRVTTTFTLSNREALTEDASLTFEIPAGSEVTYLGMVMGDQRRIARFASSADAEQAYENLVSGVVDPALLERTSSGDTTDTLRLRVFPLRRGVPAKLEVIFSVPTDQLVIDPGKRGIPRVDIERDGARASYSKLSRAVSIPIARELGETDRLVDKVDDDVSLFIDEPPAFDEPLVRVRRDPRVNRRPRGAFRISEACQNNPLAPDCM